MAGEMPGGAVIVGLVDGDIQAAIADDVAGVLEAADVAELRQDRDRGQRPDPVDVLDQRPAARLFARDLVQLRIERDEPDVERVDDRKRNVELLTGRGRKAQAGDPLAALEREQVAALRAQRKDLTRLGVGSSDGVRGRT